MENQLSKQPSNVVGTIKFKDFSPENPHTELLRFLDGLCLKLSLPSLEEMQILYIAQFLVKEFKWASMEDIDNAILKAKANKLKSVNGADYKKLSIDFLGRVLTAYRPIKGEIERDKALIIESGTKSLEYDNDSPLVAYNHIKSVFQSEQGGANAFPDLMLADWTICYHYLIEAGKMVEQSLEDKIEFAEIVRADMEQEFKNNRTSENSIAFKIKMEKGLMKYAVAAECIKRLTKAWFLTNINNL